MSTFFNLVHLTASLLSSSLTAWMVSLHSASRVSYRCSLVSSLDACRTGTLIMIYSGIVNNPNYYI